MLDVYNNTRLVCQIQYHMYYVSLKTVDITQSLTNMELSPNILLLLWVVYFIELVSVMKCDIVVTF